jgi:phosphocarrier protein HPr
MPMPERRAVVASKIGLHLRVAAEFARLAGRQLPVRVMVAKEGKDPVEARRMLDVLKLDVLGGQEVLLSAHGEGAERALDEMVAFVETDHDTKPAAGGEVRGAQD